MMSYNQTVEALKAKFQIDETGLSPEAVEKNRETYGVNELRSIEQMSLLGVFISQFKDFLVWILIAAALISGVLGKVESTLVILVVLMINAILGTVQHVKAEASINALKALSAPRAKVVRSGEVVIIDSKDIVAGDLLVVETGDYIAADGRLIQSSSLRIDESPLTGESISAEKNTDNISETQLSPGDQKNMVFSGTHVTYGRGLAIVTSVGGETEIGKIAHLLEQAKEKATPLQRSLDAFGKKLAIFIILIAVVVFLLQVMRGHSIVDGLMFSVSLAVAAIPEALSSIVTIVLALGTRKMAKENAIIRKLHAVEGLGSVSVVCSDKTGTLTQNKMTVKEIVIDDKRVKTESIQIAEALEKKLVTFSMLCSDAVTTEANEVGDPTEIALVKLGEVHGMDEADARNQYPRISELPFDSDRKLMSTLHHYEGKKVMVIKGAIDVMLKRASHIERKTGISPLDAEGIHRLEAMNLELSQGGLRVLAIGYKVVEHDFLSHEDESAFTLLGLVAMIDPPRPESQDAVKQCKEAGIKTVMITGDHVVTASAIAREIGILEGELLAIEGSHIETLTDKELQDLVPKVAVYARVSPEHKIRIVSAWQALGHSVAMTGDGVNDAPALKQADIGVAMGITGTEVSKNAASMVLMDDNFATIVKAIGNGRSLYLNIKNAVKFLLSGNTAGILAVVYTSVANLPAPFAPVHLLFINLLTDSLPAIAIGLEPASKSVLLEKPRPINEPLLTKKFSIEILLQGLLIAIVTLAAYYMGLSQSHGVAMTMAFAVLSLARLLHGLNCRTEEPLTLKHLKSNPYSLYALVLGAGLLGTALTFKPLMGIFEVSSLSQNQFLTILGLALVPLVWIQIYRRIRNLFISKR